jgi:hypothetical protein
MAGFDYDTKEMLRGIEKIDTVVEVFSKGQTTAKTRSMENNIKKDVERKLRLASIKAGKIATTPQQKMSVLSVVVTIQTFDTKLSIVDTLALYRTEVKLERVAMITINKESFKIFPIVWNHNFVGYFGRIVDMNSVIRTRIKDQIDTLLNDCLAVNPIKPTAPKGGK